MTDYPNDRSKCDCCHGCIDASQMVTLKGELKYQFSTVKSGEYCRECLVRFLHFGPNSFKAYWHINKPDCCCSTPQQTKQKCLAPNPKP